MKQISIICVGKNKQPYITDSINDYFTRVSKLIPCKIEYLKETKQISDPDRIIEEESTRLLTVLNKSKNRYSILLDIQGKQLQSERFSEFIEAKFLATDHIQFIVGGAYGVSVKIKEMVDYQLSLSKMTFNHQIVRIMLLEQIYRAQSIVKGIPYHK